MLERAKRETGVSKPEERPEIVAEFSHFPNELEAIEDVIHELRAKAQACVGTDQSVRCDVEWRVEIYLFVCLFVCPVEVVDEFNEREKQIMKLKTEVRPSVLLSMHLTLFAKSAACNAGYFWFQISKMESDIENRDTYIESLKQMCVCVCVACVLAL